MKQNELPLYNGLLNHVKTNPISFHVPGHKNSTVFPSLKQNVFQELLQVDQTELSGLDDLHSANGMIKEAQELAAALYKVEKSFFLVGGSTAGNLTMILATCEANDTVLVQRNSHKSIMNALKLADVQPVFLNPEYDSDGQIATSVSYQTVEAAIKQYPFAKSLILTSPNYYGIVSKELRKIINLAHANGLIVLVDEAHGAHFILGDPFPPSAVQLGADIVVQSAHKTLPAMTMGSFLHVNSPKIDLEQIQYYLQVVQSSSPSYPIMASLDIARYYLAHITENEKRSIIDHLHNFREQLATIPQLVVITNKSNTYFSDPLKLIVQTNCELSGYGMQQEFEKQSIFTELADPLNVLFVLPLAVVHDWTSITDRLKRAVEHKPLHSNPLKMIYSSINHDAVISNLAINYKDMKKYKKEVVPLGRAVGRIAAAPIIPYPPGVPLIMEGEEIMIQQVEKLRVLINTGAYIQNGKDIFKNGLEVFKM
ncbi:aminotransferase class I/II-fold pyridoxal phosphate-dependent enzyme [Schinkia sp. CFF1]